MPQSPPPPGARVGTRAWQGFGSLSSASVSWAVPVIISSEGPSASSGHGNRPCGEWSLFLAMCRAGCGEFRAFYSQKLRGQKIPPKYHAHKWCTVRLPLPLTNSNRENSCHVSNSGSGSGIYLSVWHSFISWSIEQTWKLIIVTPALQMQKLRFKGKWPA